MKVRLINFYGQHWVRIKFKQTFHMPHFGRKKKSWKSYLRPPKGPNISWRHYFIESLVLSASKKFFKNVKIEVVEEAIELNSSQQEKQHFSWRKLEIKITWKFWRFKNFLWCKIRLWDFLHSASFLKEIFY